MLNFWQCFLRAVDRRRARHNNSIHVRVDGCAHNVDCSVNVVVVRLESGLFQLNEGHFPKLCGLVGNVIHIFHDFCAGLEIPDISLNKFQTISNEIFDVFAMPGDEVVYLTRTFAPN